MADIIRSDIVRIDLNQGLIRKHVGAILATGDSGANRFGVEVYRDGVPITLDGCGVTGYFMRPGETTLVLQGRASGSVAYVDLEQDCYSKDSSFSLAVKISGEGITNTVRIIDGYIVLTQGETLVLPGRPVPALDELFAQIAAVEHGVKMTAAPAIISAAMGEVVSITDSADRPLAGLTLCGKTTQDGTPSPNNPAPLVNVGAVGSISVTVENGGSLTASTPNGLAGIPVDGSGHYMDGNGVQWFSDYKDYKAGVHVQNIHVLDAASIEWNPNSINHAGDGFIFYTILHGTLGDRGMMSNRFRENQIPPSGSWDVLNVGEATVIVDQGGDIAYVILCMPAEISTADALNVYFAANHTTFLCVGKAPVITPIPAEEMTAFRALKTHKPDTTVGNDAGAFMYVDYIADTKLYIDKKIAAIAAASLNV